VHEQKKKEEQIASSNSSRKVFKSIGSIGVGLFFVEVSVDLSIVQIRSLQDSRIERVCSFLDRFDRLSNSSSVPAA
jgi:hypothetical protein